MKVSIITIGLCIFYFTASSASPSPQGDSNNPCNCRFPNSELCRNRRKEIGCSLTDTSTGAVSFGAGGSGIHTTESTFGACNWSSWTECSKTCDIGSQERSRAENCNGDSKETKSCGKPDWCLLETLKNIFW